MGMTFIVYVYILIWRRIRHIEFFGEWDIYALLSYAVIYSDNGLPSNL